MRLETLKNQTSEIPPIKKIILVVVGIGFASLILISSFYVGYDISEDGELQLFSSGDNFDDEEFIIKVDTRHSSWASTNSKQFKIRTNSEKYSYNYNVSTNDEVVNATSELKNVSGDLLLEYKNPGVHTVKISGRLPHMHYKLGGHSRKIISIENWGDIRWKNMSSMFKGADRLDSYDASDKPDLSSVRSMNGMFYKADRFNGSIGGWNTSNVEDMSFMLDSADEFDKDIEEWDTSSVDNMSYMFHSADRFNQNLSGWDTSDVEDMSSMFRSADSFNGNVSSWDTSSVKDMRGMFSTAHQFNRDIGDWNTSNVKHMGFMFNYANKFNKDIADWNTSNVKDMGSMFQDASSFNQNISSWCVSEINDEPEGFDDRSSIDRTDKTPNWGTSC